MFQGSLCASHCSPLRLALALSHPELLHCPLMARVTSLTLQRSSPGGGQIVQLRWFYYPPFSAWRASAMSRTCAFHPTVQSSASRHLLHRSHPVAWHAPSVDSPRYLISGPRARNFACIVALRQGEQPAKSRRRRGEDRGLSCSGLAACLESRQPDRCGGSVGPLMCTN